MTTLGERIDAARKELMHVSALVRLLALGESDRDTGHDDGEIVETAMTHLAKAESQLYWFTRLSPDVQKTAVPDLDEEDELERQQSAKVATP